MNIARVESKLIVVSAPTGQAAYDFDFDLHFTCQHPYRIEGEERCVLRVGPIADYDARFHQMLGMGVRPINSPEEHALASELERWYPRIERLTFRSRVFDSLPAADEIEALFRWPVFIKGSRQTSKHNPELSVVRDRDHYDQVVRMYQDDPILHWQKPIVREFVPLMPVAGQIPGKISPSVEYRTFWWFGACVGWGRYWHQVAPYECHDIELGLAVARRAAQHLKVPFLVVDIAKTAFGRWMVVECNDAQESGYAGIQPYELWRSVLAQVGS